MSKLEIRNAVSGDLDGLVALFLTCFNAPPWNDGWSAEAARERLSDLLGARHFRGAVAVLGSAVVGMLVGQRERWIESFHFNLVEMCVAPAKQRSGVGSALLDHLRQQLRQEHTGGIYLLTARAGAAEAFYSKHGFHTSPGRIMMTCRLTSEQA